MATEPSEVLGFGRESIAELAQPADLRQVVTTTLARDLYRTLTQYEAATALERLTLFLHQEARGAADSRIPMTQEQIAPAVGLTRETVNRHLRELSERGQVTLRRGTVVVHDLGEP